MEVFEGCGEMVFRDVCTCNVNGESSTNVSTKQQEGGGTWKDGTTTVFVLRGVFGCWTLEGTTLCSCHGGEIVAFVGGGSGGTTGGDGAVGGVGACVCRIDGCHGGCAGMHS